MRFKFLDNLLKISCGNSHLAYPTFFLGDLQSEILFRFISGLVIQLCKIKATAV